MPSLKGNLSSSTLVHIVFEHDGQRRWFNHTDRKRDDRTGSWYTLPVVGTEAHESKPMTLEMALISQRRWRELGMECRLALEPTGEFIDSDSKIENPPWEHTNYLVTCDENGLPSESLDAQFVYNIKAVRTVNGRAFVLKFETPILQNQSQFSDFEEGPEMCVRRAFDRGLTKLEPPKPNPHLEARRLETERRAAQATRLPNNLRPGDR